jgi:hypothetical protein
VSNTTRLMELTAAEWAAVGVKTASAYSTQIA